MDTKHQRRHTRISFQTNVDLKFNNKGYSQCPTQDLCLSGMRVLDCLDQQTGDECEIEFHQTGMVNNRLLRLKGEVVRVDDQGIALVFTGMNFNSYTNLQSIMIDNAEDPFQIAEEFLEQLPANQ